MAATDSDYYTKKLVCCYDVWVNSVKAWISQDRVVHEIFIKMLQTKNCCLVSAIHVKLVLNNITFVHSSLLQLMFTTRRSLRSGCFKIFYQSYLYIS